MNPAERLSEIRARWSGVDDVSGNTYAMRGFIDVPWLLERIAHLEGRVEALRRTGQGFMDAVRMDTGTAYPWDPWEVEIEKTFTPDGELK